jgi:N-acetylglucosamine transport system substrate-binding protein
MKKWIVLGVFASFVLIGCSGGDSPQSAVKPSSEAPGELSGNLEVAAFQGGYGIDFYQKTADEFGKLHPDLKIKVEGNPRIWEQLRPRFVGGNPPDLAFPGWGMDHWALAEEDQLLDLTEALKGKPAEGGGTWGDTFDPAMLRLGQLNGKQYVLPYYMMLLGWWYDPAVFAANGWTPPKTYEDLLALCEKIKAKGIAPITYQGKYPYYMIDGMLLPWALSQGGEEAVVAAQNMVPGAWKSPAFIKAASMIKELSDKGFFQQGATAMSHTESQQQFLDGKAAMIPCGTWLYSEMKEVMPARAQMEFMLPPVLAEGQSPQGAVIVAIEPWMVPSAAKNPAAAIEFFKYMTSKTKAKQFIEEKGTLMAIKGSEVAKLPPVLVKPAKTLAASQYVYSVQYRQWYPAFNTEIENALTAMLNDESTAVEFCNRIEAAAEKVRNDSSIAKHRL